MIKYYLTPKAIKAGCKFEQPAQGDSGYDVYSAEQVTLNGNQSKWIKTGLYLKIPSTGLYPRVGIIKDRSGFAGDNAIYTHAGVIDSQYRGEIKILLENTFAGTYVIKRGAKIAQLIIIKHLAWPTKRVDSVDELGQTKRGSDGFGSTGT